jgi:hypothetical protein
MSKKSESFGKRVEDLGGGILVNTMHKVLKGDFVSSPFVDRKLGVYRGCQFISCLYVMMQACLGSRAQ